MVIRPDCGWLKKRVAVVVQGTKYEGIVSEVSDSQISLHSVYSETLKKRLPNVLILPVNEIDEVSLLDGVQVNSPPSNNVIKGKRLVTRQEQPSHISKLNNEIDVNVLLNREPVVAKNNESKSEDVNIPPFTVIDSIDDSFRNAIKEAMTENIIGVSMEGVRLGREGIVCWIGIGLREKVYLFDMCSLGPPGIRYGLGDLFTHESIVKVLHDCRFVADVLLHKYGVQLCNVFDTQVADAVLTKRTTGSFSKFVNSLPNSLQVHLNLPEEALFFRRVRLSCREEDESIWRERPLPPHLQRAAVLQVCFLRELRVVLMEKLLSDVIKGTELYLQEVSNLPDDEATFKLDSAHLLPVEFNKLPERTTPAKRSGEDSPRRFAGNECDPYLRFSRDTFHRTNK